MPSPSPRLTDARRLARMREVDMPAVLLLGQLRRISSRLHVHSDSRILVHKISAAARTTPTRAASVQVQDEVLRRSD